MKKKIVIFGATGNIGKYFVDYLNSHLNLDEYEIIASGRRNTDWFEKNHVKYYSLDISSKEAFDVLPRENIYSVVNLAGVLPAYLETNDPLVYIDTNITGGINILEYTRKTDCKRILYTQTWAEMQGFWGKESVLSPKLPRNISYTGDHAFYTITKCMIVDTLEMYHQQYGIKPFIFRLPNIYLYSPEKYYFVDGVKKYISYRYMIDRVKQGVDLELWGNPEDGKDIIYIKDFCQMMYKALFANVDGGTYCAGTGVHTTLQQQLEGFIKVFAPKGTSPKIIYRPDMPTCVDFVMDIENAKKELGYQPEYDYISYLEDYKKEEESGRWENI